MQELFGTDLTSKLSINHDITATQSQHFHSRQNIHTCLKLPASLTQLIAFNFHYLSDEHLHEIILSNDSSALLKDRIFHSLAIAQLVSKSIFNHQLFLRAHHYHGPQNDDADSQNAYNQHQLSIFLDYFNQDIHKVYFNKQSYKMLLPNIESRGMFAIYEFIIDNKKTYFDWNGEDVYQTKCNGIDLVSCIQISIDIYSNIQYLCKAL